MRTPLIALYSENPPAASDLRRQLEILFDVDVCRGPLRELPQQIDALQPDGLIADFTNAECGGHAEADVVDAIQQSRPELPIVMATGAACPEPLARQAACSGLVHVIDAPPFAKVAEAIGKLVIDLPSCEQDRDRVAGSYSDVVIRGMSRTVETSTLSMKLMLQELELAAGHDVTILLIGETGVGKTYLGRLIHEISPRRENPFLTVACGALPDDLIESELFGHAKGAFTGAHTDKEGKFLAAGGGTILLDEIDVLGPEQQVKLLRVIETGEFEPVGSNRTHQSAARLVVASNLQLEPLVEQGKFRADLYYRLNMLKFDIPALRDRMADVSRLAEKFIRQHAARHGVRIDRLDDSLMRALQQYAWPGNVRELENVLRRAVIYCRDGVLTSRHLPSHVIAGDAGPSGPTTPTPIVTSSNTDSPQTLEDQVEVTEREVILQALDDHNYSRTKTAKALGISRVTLYNKIRKYDIVLS